jgi:hypothetical protein
MFLTLFRNPNPYTVQRFEGKIHFFPSNSFKKILNVFLFFDFAEKVEHCKKSLDIVHAHMMMRNRKSLISNILKHSLEYLSFSWNRFRGMVE